MTLETLTAKPFLKWAGGKTQLLSEISKFYPFAKNPSITKYAEPFVGGGAVLFDILNKFNLKQIYISDINFELINTYLVIRDRLDPLLIILQSLADHYLILDLPDRRKFYYEQRAKFNEIKSTQSDSTTLAALMIFLNKTCFNGLYRVNRQGDFNVPVGSYKNPKICDIDSLKAVSQKLQNVEIVCADYHESANFIDEHTFVYLDPPYRPLTPTANFTSYTEHLFNDANQLELAKFVQMLDNKGASVVVSNSDPKNTDPNDDFFDRAYESQNVQRISAKRSINRNGGLRGFISELLISNFNLEDT